jgi:hypothetical protein
MPAKKDDKCSLLSQIDKRNELKVQRVVIRVLPLVSGQSSGERFTTFSSGYNETLLYA